MMTTKHEGKNLWDLIEEKYTNPKLQNFPTIQVGDLIKIAYKITEGEKERTQYYEGIVIAKQNRGLGKSITIRRTVQGVGVEQIFLLNSPKIDSIIKKQSSKVRRAKLYYLRSLVGKAAILKPTRN